MGGEANICLVIEQGTLVIDDVCHCGVENARRQLEPGLQFFARDALPQWMGLVIFLHELQALFLDGIPIWGGDQQAVHRLCAFIQVEQLTIPQQFRYGSLGSLCCQP